FDHLASLKVALGGMPGKYMATSDHPLEKYGYFFPGQVFLLPRLPDLAVAKRHDNAKSAAQTPRPLIDG
ncbi:hypothetical protein QOU62_31495, partial [Pseudomonas aeruginosa]